MWDKSFPCSPNPFLVEQIFRNLKRGGQVWAFVLSGAPHKEWARPFIDPWTWACWARQALSHILSSSLKNMVLEPECKPFYSNYGENFYRYAAKEPKFNKLFQEFMTHSSKLFLDEALKVYRGFEEIKELLNVGGGMGTSLGNIISMYPHIHGKNFDLPNVISVALELSGLKFSSFLIFFWQCLPITYTLHTCHFCTKFVTKDMKVVRKTC